MGYNSACVGNITEILAPSSSPVPCVFSFRIFGDLESYTFSETLGHTEFETGTLPHSRNRGNDDATAAGDGAVASRSAAVGYPRNNIPDTAQSADAMAADTVPSESLQDETVMSNDETILTPVNADNDGN